MVSRHRQARGRPFAAGYTLVALIVIVAVMSVLVAAVLPMWSNVMKRDREAELVFRGLQYAEAIRVFQLRFGRLPNTLDELIDVNPRSIRQLWKDPMDEDGRWGLIFAPATPRPGQPRSGRAQPGRPQSAERSQARRAFGQQEEEDGRSGGGGRRRTSGPIFGVHSRSDGEALRSFVGGSSYNQWLFTVDIVPQAAVDPATLNVRRATSEWVGKPFREELQPQQGEGPDRPEPQDRRRQRQQPLG